MLAKTQTLATAGLTIPRSIVFTPDKNRTWAQSFGLDALMGHKSGRDTAETIVRECLHAGVRDVVFWAMSQSNIYKRSTAERNQLVELLKEKLKEQEEKADDNEGFYLCGTWRKVISDQELEGLVERAHARNAKARYQDKRLTVLFGYRGITDFKQAASRVAEKYGAEAIENEDLIRSKMWVRHLPEKVDMFVRTGVTDDNRHNSDSLLPLHGENAFVYDVPVYWPDFTVEHLYEGFRRFSACHRAKGA